MGKCANVQIAPLELETWPTHHRRGLRQPAQDRRRAVLVAVEAAGEPRVRWHCRFKKRGTDYLSESGMKRMSGRTTR